MNIFQTIRQLKQIVLTDNSISQYAVEQKRIELQDLNWDKLDKLVQIKGCIEKDQTGLYKFSFTSFVKKLTLVGREARTKSLNDI